MSPLPQALSHTSSRVLEFDALRELLSGYAWSSLGKARVNSLSPTGDRGWIETQQQMAAEIRQFLRVGGSFDFSGLQDPKQLLEQATIEGAALEPNQIREILLVADRADEWSAIMARLPSNLRPAEA